MKIVHVGKYFYPDVGGIENVTKTLAIGAVSHGLEVAAVVFGKVKETRVDKIEGVEVHRVPILVTIASQPFGWRYLRSVGRVCQCADVVHLHMPNLFGAFVLMLFCRKKKVLVHWHSDIIGKGFFGLCSKPLVHFLLLMADSIVATSHAYLESSSALTRYRNKVDVVPIGIDDCALGRVRCLEPWDIISRCNGRKVVLSVGRLVEYKGFDILINAAGQLGSNVVIVIVGEGPLDQSLRDQIKALAVEDRVLMTGKIDRDSLAALYNHARVFCLPSNCRAEAFGVVLLEALAYGLPIVATQIPGSGVSWVNQHGVTGLNVPIGDSCAIASALISIINDDQLHHLLSQGARDRFVSEFTVDKFIERTVGIYRRLIG